MNDSSRPGPYNPTTDPVRIGRNLENWVEITAFCLELRKSVIKLNTGVTDDEELTIRVFSEAVRNKEKK